jgi:DNA polymerase
MPAKHKRTDDAAHEKAPASLAALNRMIAAAAPVMDGSPHAVLGEGPMRPALAFVGEQPGDQEDIQRRPFVGPAGKLFDRALEAAGIDRAQAYVTNAVKHFKFVPRGKRRLHQRPTAGEVRHYRWWLDLELGFARPKLIVALGATAVLALEGRTLPVGRNRGPHDFNGRPGFITVHPSFLLRLRGPEDREREYAAFVADLKAARRLAA